MYNDGLKINTEVKSDLDVIQNDINEINDVLQKVYAAMLTLDENEWKSDEKDKIDAEFVPYLKKFTEKYSSYLEKRLNFVRNAIESHENLDAERAKLTDINIF